MKEIKCYTRLTGDLIDRLNSEEFKFVTFTESMKNIELVTVERNNSIEGYAILEHSNNMNQDFYVDILCEIKDRYTDMIASTTVSLSNEDIYDQRIKTDIWDIEEFIEILSYENNEHSKKEIIALNKLKELLQNTPYSKYSENKSDISNLKESIRFYKDNNQPLNLDCLNEDNTRELDLLNSVKESIAILEEKDFYYISYIECIPSNSGNGTDIVNYIKEHYNKTVLIPSGYTPHESSTGFWEKQGYKKSELLMFNA